MYGYLIATCLAVWALLPLFTWLLGYRNGKSSMLELAHAATQEGLAESNAALRQSAEELAFVKGRWHEEETRADSFSSVVAGILKERDQWRDLYFEESVAHGNAQADMMAFIEAAVHALKKAGINVVVPPVLAELQNTHANNHANPSRSAQNGNKVIESAEQFAKSQGLASPEGTENVRG